MAAGATLRKKVAERPYPIGRKKAHMAKQRDDRVSRLVVGFLRLFADKTQTDFAEASGVYQADVSRYESGAQTPTEKTLRRRGRRPHCRTSRCSTRSYRGSSPPCPHTRPPRCWSMRIRPPSTRRRRPTHNRSSSRRCGPASAMPAWSGYRRREMSSRPRSSIATSARCRRWAAGPG